MVLGTLTGIGIIKSSKIYANELAVEKNITETRPLPQIYSKDYLKLYVGEISVEYGLTGEQYNQMMSTINC